MNANKELIHKEEVYQIVGAAIEVLNGLGHGLSGRIFDSSHSRLLAFIRGKNWLAWISTEHSSPKFWDR